MVVRRRRQAGGDALPGYTPLRAANHARGIFAPTWRATRNRHAPHRTGIPASGLFVCGMIFVHPEDDPPSGSGGCGRRRLPSAGSSEVRDGAFRPAPTTPCDLRMIFVRLGDEIGRRAESGRGVVRTLPCDPIGTTHPTLRRPRCRRRRELRRQAGRRDRLSRSQCLGEGDDGALDSRPRGAHYGQHLSSAEARTFRSRRRTT